MHVLFIHPNFPAQFGPICVHCSNTRKWNCTFLTSVDTSHLKELPFQCISYRVKPDTPPPKQFFNPDFKGLMDHLAGVYLTMRQLKQFKPDLVVGHMAYGTMLYLKNLYDCPFVGYYELLPPPFWSEDFVLRKEYPPSESVRLTNATYHSLTHLHLHAVDACYAPTEFQKNTAPEMFRDKIEVIFDGIDASRFRPQDIPRPVTFRGVTITPDTRVVTYVSRGLESVRGFDIFMKVAKRVYQQMDNVVFLIAGSERTAYGHELAHIGEKSFKEHVLSQDDYDLSKIRFLGRIPPNELAMLYNLSDLHIYLTVPYVLSWSMILALSSGCVVLGSDTIPVREAIEDGVNGLLADFYDVDTLTARALEVLKEPQLYHHLAVAARQRVLDEYDLTICCRKLVDFFENVAVKMSSN